MLGDQYTFVDMALWGWARAVPFIFGPEGFAKFPHVKKWFDGVNARPAVARAEALKDKHAFKTENDAEARAAMFPHLAKKVA
jgi:GST-like protein